MIPPELARRARELADARQPFVTATVVRAQRPTSVRAGSVALVLADGTIEGFAGGVCTEQSLKAQSLRALATGEPVLLRVLPEGAPEPAEEEGAVTVANPCLSGGAIELFIEPSLPAPRVLVAGDSPIAAALERMGAEAGLEVLAAGGTAAPGEGVLGLVVAAHGRDELRALRAGLDAGLPYVGLVASETRAAAVLDELRSGGVGEGELERIESPAGIPIGSHTPGEIAVSILARLIAIRREPPTGTTTGTVPSVPADPAPLAVDPICGMTVAAVPSTPSLEREGRTVYFCGEGCKAKFEAEGERASVPG